MSDCQLSHCLIDEEIEIACDLIHTRNPLVLSVGYVVAMPVCQVVPCCAMRQKKTSKPSNLFDQITRSNLNLLKLLRVYAGVTFVFPKSISEMLGFSFRRFPRGARFECTLRYAGAGDAEMAGEEAGEEVTEGKRAWSESR